MTDQGQTIRRRRKELRLSQQALGAAVGAHPQTIDKIERGQIKFSRYLFPIADRLGILHELTLGGHHPALPTVPADASATEPPPLVGPRDVPVFGSIESGRDMHLSGAPISYTLRPLPLATVKEAYAVLVSTEAMHPVYEVGDTILLHPHLPPEAGKDVLLRLKHNDGELAAIGRLERITDSNWIVRQWNRGNRTVSYDRGRWPRCHRIIGKYNR